MTSTERPAATRAPDRSDVLARAKAGYDAWYDAEPAPGEEDSPSHEYVREIVPELIEALEIAQAELAAERAKHTV